MRTIVLTDALASLAVVGRTRFTFKLPVDAQLSLADGDDFLLLAEHERPITISHLYDAVVAAYGTLIANDQTAREDGTYRYDAQTGPAVSAVILYRVEGELQLLAPTSADKREFKKAKNRDMLVEKLPGVVVQSRARYHATLPEDVRGLVVLDVPKAWSDAADKRGQKAVKAADSKPAIEAPVVSDTTMSRILVEDVAEARARRAFDAMQDAMLADAVTVN